MDLSKFYAQFREETTENLRIFADGLLALEQDPSARDQLDAIFRAMHTVKGSSRLLGFGAIGRLAHTMEHILGAVREGSHQLDQELIDEMLRDGDALLEMTNAAIDGTSTSVNVDELIDKLNRILESKAEGGGGEPAEEETATGEETKPAEGEHPPKETQPEPSPPPAPAEQPTPAKAEEPPAAAKPPPPQQKPAQPTAEEDQQEEAAQLRSAAANRQSNKRQTIRVRVDRLDTLINLTGELVVGHQMLADHMQALSSFNELLHQQYRDLTALEAEMHSARLTPQQRTQVERALNAVLDSSDQMHQLLRTQHDQFTHNIEAQEVLINDLEQEVMAVRMLPISTVFSNLPRAVRQIARATSKDVELDIQGETTELDRKLLEALNDPLLHLVRNAVDHGIEPPDEREQAGKSRQGKVTVRAEATGSEVHISIMDDGRGMDPKKLRDIAVRKGLIAKENAELLSDQESFELIFLPGFSSAQMITDISGRGVGMDVVRTNINELGGQVTVDSQVGKGTNTHMVLPMTIVTTRILLIRVGEHTFGIPSSGCHGIIWTYQEHIHTVEGRATIEHEGQTLPLLHMADLMGIESTPPFQYRRREPAILIGSAHRLLSLLVDQLLDEREAVVKPLGMIFESQRRYSGAVQMGNGQLVLLLNPVSLAQSARGITLQAPAVGSMAARQQPRLLIAEDSFTKRELIRSILQSAGYEVTAAVDGHDALDKLRSQPYDLVVTDVEMPRVDGFELTTRIRQELENHDLPVVIITSLASDEYRRRGLEAGAQAYIVKSQFNQDNLLKVVQQLLGHEVVGG
jgi:two-component system chemotaxis sensor kinase CheA